MKVSITPYYTCNTSTTYPQRSLSKFIKQIMNTRRNGLPPPNYQLFNQITQRKLKTRLLYNNNIKQILGQKKSSPPQTRVFSFSLGSSSSRYRHWDYWSQRFSLDEKTYVLSGVLGTPRRSHTLPGSSPETSSCPPWSRRAKSPQILKAACQETDELGFIALVRQESALA